MRKPIRLDRHGTRIARLVAAVALVALATACAPDEGEPDYRDAYPLKVELESSSLSIDFLTPGAQASDVDTGRFRMFVRDFLRRARTPLTITARDDLHRRVRALLVEQGVTPGNMVFRTAATGTPGAHLEFRGYVVSVPKCGDWSGWAGFDPSNRPHTNYGCAFQRNVGLMLADPGDLVRGRPTPALDAQRSDRVLQKYREGKSAGSELPRSEEGAISDIQGK